jgi:hypothetical protein
MSKKFTDQDFVNEIDLYYKDRIINPVQPFPYHVNSMVEALFKRKDKLSFKKVDTIAVVLLIATLSSLVGSFVVGLISVGIMRTDGSPAAIVMLLAAVPMFGFFIYCIEYTDDTKYKNSLISLLTQSETFNTSFKGWLNDRYSFAVSDLTDEVVSDAFTNRTFKVKEKYYTAIFNTNVHEVTSVMEASPKEAAVYDELKFGARSGFLKEAPFNDKVVDKLEVTYL